MADHENPKKTTPGLGPPTKGRPSAQTIPAGARRDVPGSNPPPPVSSLPEAPQRQPRHVVEIPGRPDLKLGYYPEGLTALPTRAQIEARDAAAAAILAQQRREAEAANQPPVRRSWKQTMLVIVLAIGGVLVSAGIMIGLLSLILR